MQEQPTVTPRGFLHNVEPSSEGSISRSEVLRAIKVEEERKKGFHKPLDVGEMPTVYSMPAMPKTSPYTTEKMPAINSGLPIEDESKVAVTSRKVEIAEEEEDIFVEKTASEHTVDLIHEAVEELHCIPTLIVVSNLRWMAHEKLLRRIRYHHNGVRIPIVPSDGPCSFDVKVYGTRW